MNSRILFTLFVAVMLSMPLIGQHLDQRRMVTVEGEAEVLAVPDMATVSIGVVSEGKVATEVQRDNSERIRKVLASLQKLGIEAKDIQTKRVSLEPMYNWKQDGKREFLRYQMRNSIVVVVRDLAKLTDVITLGVEQGGNEIGNVGFDLSTIQSLRDSVRIAACRNAQRKAADMASAVGAKLGRVVSMTESSTWQRPEPMYRAAMVAYEAKSPEPTVSAGEIVVRVSVSASFELE